MYVEKLRRVATDKLFQVHGRHMTEDIVWALSKGKEAPGGRSREMIQFLVRRLRDLPVHSIFICGQDTDQDTTKKWFYTPLLPGKLASDIRGLVDVVGYYASIPQEGGKIIRRLFLVGGSYGSTHVAAKNRFGENLKTAYVDNPTMQTIYDLDND